MSFFTARRLAAWIFTGSLAALATTASAGSFTFSRLPSLGGAQSVAWGINDRGDVVGESTTADGARRAVRWRDGAVVDLGVGDGSVAYDINNRAAIVGERSGWPFLWRQQVVQMLPTLRGGCCALVAAVNDHGTMAGGDETYAVVWTKTRVTNLVFAGNIDIAWGISNTGVAVGCAKRASAPYEAAVLSTRAGNQFLPGAVTGPDPSACARAVNDYRQVAGYSWPDGPYFHGVRATRWDHGRPVLLDSPFDSQALAINGSALVVGQVSDASGATTAALWVGTTLVDLDQYLDPDLKAQGWVMTVAHAINESGAIAGEMHNAGTGETAAWLLVPR